MSVHSRYRTGLWHPYEKPMYGALLNPYHPLARGLVGCWLFNEGGGNIVYDLSGHGNHGTLGGGTAGYRPTWVAGKFGSALDFDGTDDYIRISPSDSLDALSDMTFIAWLKFDEYEEPRRFFNMYYNDSDRFQFEYDPVYDDLLVWNYINGEESRIFANTLPNLGTWFNFVCTVKGTVWKLYIDGDEKASSDEGRNLSDLDDGFTTYIGVRYKSSGFAGYFYGAISQVYIFNRALSVEEILQLYTDPFCMFYHSLEVELLYAAAPPAGIVPQAMHHYRMLREV